MTDDVIGRFRDIGIRAPADALSALLAHATKSRLSGTEFAEQLIALEIREREVRNLARRMADATLGTVTPLDQFDWNHARSIDRDKYEHLLQLGFLAEGENVLFRGPSGVGKTMLAQNLALRALEQGYTVRFTTLAAALADLLIQESLPSVERRLRHYTNPDLFVLDEIGYSSLTGAVRRLQECCLRESKRMVCRRYWAQQTVVGLVGMSPPVGNPPMHAP